jgi:hypothetical protein
MSKARPMCLLPVLALSAVLTMPALAQQASERVVTQSSPVAKKPARPETAKPGSRPASIRASEMRGPPTRQWTIDDALPSRTRTSEPGRLSTPELGRVPVEGGSFGFSTETKMDPYRTPDGSRIRGLESTKSDPSYLGLSLSVTTDNKSLLPRSILPNW